MLGAYLRVQVQSTELKLKYHHQPIDFNEFFVNPLLERIWTPRFAKPSIRDARKVKIARVYPDLCSSTLPRSLMEFAGQGPIG